MDKWTFELCNDGMWRWRCEKRNETPPIWSTKAFTTRGECLEDAITQCGYKPRFLNGDATSLE